VAAGAVGALIWFDPAKRPSATPGDAGVEISRVPVTALDAGSNRVEVEPDAASVAVGAEVAIDAEIPEAETPLYTLNEALTDISASPLVFVGTGEWFGNFSIHGCAYRNARVIVVYVYCTVREQPALELVVLSPTRGRVLIYAEGSSPISTLKRSDYFNFRAEVQPPDPAAPLALGVSYADLRAWDERRYHSRLGSCWTGDTEGCGGGLEPRLPAWSPSAKAFLDDPPAVFYQLAKDFHARAVRDSRRSKS
jgi:hypothetical protein